MKKLIVSSEQLSTAFSKVGLVVNTKNPLPVLANLYCRVSEKQLELVASNIALTIFYRMECEASEAFEFLLPFEFIKKIVALNKHCRIEIELGKKLKIKGINDEYEIKVGQKLEEYPKMPELPKKNSLVIGKDILGCFATAVFTTLPSDERFANVLFELRPGEITVASSDGTYMVYSHSFRQEHEFTEDLQLTDSLINVLHGCETATVFFHSKSIGFESSSITVVATRNEGKYPNFRKVFPDEWPANLTIIKEALVDGLFKCSLSNDQLRTTTIELGSDMMKMNANDGVININVDVPATYSGSIPKTVVNSDKLLKLLKQIKHEELSLAIHDANKAIIITTKEDEGYKGMIMPISI